jgi:hypothetical protein
MKAVIEAIVTRYASTDGASLRGSVNGLFPYVAPAKTATPYITYSVPTSGDESFMGATQKVITTFRVQFSIWDSSPSPKTAMEIAEKVISLYDFARLSVTGYCSIVCRRVFENLLRDPNKGWQYVLQYEIQVQK